MGVNRNGMHALGINTKIIKRRIIMDSTNTAKEVHSGRFPWGADETIKPEMTMQKATIIDTLSENTTLINKMNESFRSLYCIIHDPQANFDDAPFILKNVDCVKSEIEYQNDALKSLCKMLAVLLEQFERS